MRGSTGIPRLLLFPAQAGASHLASSLSLSVGSDIHRVSGVFLTVPVEVTCPVLPLPLAAIFSDHISVAVIQKSGKGFATGSGTFSYQNPIFNGIGVGTPLICDGSAHTYVVNVFPETPYYGGQAVATASLELTVFDPLNPCVFCTADSNFVTSDPQPIKIRG